MQMTKHFCAALIIVSAFSATLGQTGDEARERDANKSTTQTTATGVEMNGTEGTAEPYSPTIWIHLVGGRRMQVDEVTEAADGVWFRRGNMTTFIDRVKVERIERSTDPRLTSLSDTFAGSLKWSISDSGRIQSFFMSTFNRPLPLTALGQSELHTRWGLDHRRSMDVGLHPDSLEGKTLIRYLVSERIPFLAFRGSVPGVATGPHIHIGHGSPRLPANR